MPDPAAALTREDARALLAPLAGANTVLLAVSGGPDSVALMRLAADLAASDPAFPPLSVATVDHGLRPASRADAEGVAATAASLSLPCHLLSWVGPKPATRVQEQARHHRYALLTDCARRIGATHLVTAHTRDDQAETILFRLMRGSGPAGLAGMMAEVERGGVRHLRPLLDVAKARLVATCRAEGWSFLDDPANADPRFARARLRTLMPALADEGLDAARFATLGRRMAEADAALVGAARRAIIEAARATDAYGARRLLAEPAAVRHRIFGLLLSDLAAAPERPRLDSLERLVGAIERAASMSAPLRRTLHGTVVSFDGQDSLRLGAAPPRRRPRD